MADKGIIFSAPMVRALLDGRKTQTRRIIKPCPWPEDREPPYVAPYAEGARAVWCDDYDCSVRPLPFPAVGDRLYVREAAWIAPPGWTDSPANPMGPHRQEVAYAADDRSGYTAEAAKDYGLRLRPSIHMPRWASRLTLLVTDVRVQRVAEIGSGDAIAEGVERHGIARGWKNYRDDRLWCGAPETSFESLWNSLHTKPGERWEDNPWIVAVSFTVHHGNIDRLAA